MNSASEQSKGINLQYVIIETRLPFTVDFKSHSTKSEGLKKILRSWGM